MEAHKKCLFCGKERDFRVYKLNWMCKHCLKSQFEHESMKKYRGTHVSVKESL
jgi:ribosomal protein L37AE/L43A